MAIPLVHRRPLFWVVLGLCGLGVLLQTTHVNGPFLVDECNYLVTVTGLSQGKLSVPGTENLTGSPSLAYFDPAARYRTRHTSPVASTVPPLYAFLALPFGLFGWGGLVALNVLSFVICGLLVFVYAGRHASRPTTRYAALGLFLFGTYCLEYAQGVWPQMLSMALAFGGVVLAARVRNGGSMANALAGGLLVGLATGVRYQNLLVAGALGLGLLLWGRRKLEGAAVFTLGLGLPLGFSSVLNLWRHGWWNPVSKGQFYLRFLSADRRPASPREPLAVLWAKLVDFSSHPPVGFLKDSRTASGVYLLHQALKKAWAQSSPWILTALAALVWSWNGGLNDPNETDPVRRGRRRELRALSLVVVTVLGVFASAGFARTDGFCFNQRYFVELLPLMAVAMAWAAEEISPRRGWLVWGLAVGGVGLWMLYHTTAPTDAGRHLVVLRGAMAVSLTLVVLWLFGRQRGLLVRPLWLLLGVAVAWSAMVHFHEDVLSSRHVRQRRGWVTQRLTKVLPTGPSAVFAHFPGAINICPLHLTHDVVVVNTALDGGQHSLALVDQFLTAGRRVFVSADQHYPPNMMKRLLKNRAYRLVYSERKYQLVEILR